MAVSPPRRLARRGGNAATFTLSVLDDHLPRRTKGIAGVASGVLGLVVGAPYAWNAGQRRTFARWDAGVGAVSLVLGIVRWPFPPSPRRNHA